MKIKTSELQGAALDWATIQIKNSSDRWVDTCANSPTWSVLCEYRIKPEPLRYRVALLAGAAGGSYTTTVDDESGQESLTLDSRFIRWLTDWIEYQV